MVEKKLQGMQVKGETGKLTGAPLSRPLKQRLFWEMHQVYWEDFFSLFREQKKNTTK